MISHFLIHILSFLPLSQNLHLLRKNCKQDVITNITQYSVEKLDEYEKSIFREFTLSASAAAKAENQRQKNDSTFVVGNKRVREDAT